MNRCGCNPILESYEYKIEDTKYSSKTSNLSELFPIINDLLELKNKIICEFLGIVNNLECGILPDLGFLLEEISLVEIIEENG